MTRGYKSRLVDPIASEQSAKSLLVISAFSMKISKLLFAYKVACNRARIDIRDLVETSNKYICMP